MSRRRTRWTAAALAMVTLLAAGYGLDVLVNSRSFQLVGTLISHTDPGRQRVALTLDDGPSERTAEVLRVLDQAGVPATFYLIGRELAARPDDGRRIAAAGHEIGNHTYTHRRMVFVSSDTVRDEVERTDELIRATGYPGPITFRRRTGRSSSRCRPTSPTTGASR